MDELEQSLSEYGQTDEPAPVQTEEPPMADTPEPPLAEPPPRAFGPDRPRPHVMDIYQGGRREQYHYDAQGRLDPRDEAMGQQLLAQAQQRAQLQAILNRPFGQRDAVRLRQLQAGIAYVEQRVREGGLNRQDGMELMTELMQGSTVLEARKRQTEAKIREQQLETQVHLRRLATVQAGQDANALNELLAPAYKIDDLGGGHRMARFVGPDGKVHYQHLAPERTEAEKPFDEAKARRQAQAAVEGGMTEKFDKEAPAHIAKVNREVEAARRLKEEPAPSGRVSDDQAAEALAEYNQITHDLQGEPPTPKLKERMGQLAALMGRHANQGEPAQGPAADQAKQEMEDIRRKYRKLSDAPPAVIRRYKQLKAQAGG